VIQLINKKKAIVIAIANALFAHNTLADVAPKSHIGLLGFDFQSDVEAQYGYDDNVTYQKNNEVGSDFYSIKPKVGLVGERKGTRLEFFYEGDYRDYLTDDEDPLYPYDADSDEYFDHNFGMYSDFQFGKRSNLTFNIANAMGHEERGQGVTEGFTGKQLSRYGVDEVIKTNFFSSSLGYSYLRPESSNSLHFEAGYAKLSYYDLDDDLDADLKTYISREEWHSLTLSADLLSQWSSVTRARYSVINIQRHYEEKKAKNTNEYYFLFGLKSQLTGKTAFEGNIAWMIKTFPENNDAEDDGSFNWDINLTWEPVRHSRFDLYTKQSVEDADEAGGYILNTTYGIKWKHSWWVDQLSTTTGYEYTTNNHTNSGGRKDDTTIALFKINYDFRPSISFELLYQLDLNNSNRDTEDFDMVEGNTVTRTLGYDKSFSMFLIKVKI